MHVIIETNPWQGILGRLTVLKNMALGSSPMKDDALRLKVNSLKEELKSTQ
jgi:hypothetical protein